MPRATAASTMEPVLGPRRTSSSSSRSAASAAARSKRRVVAGRRRHSSCGQLEREAADGFLAVLDHHLVDAGLDGGRGAAEGDRAAGLGLQRQRGQLQHMGQRHRRRRGRSAQRRRCAGSSARSRASKPGSRPMAHSASVQVTIASMAVWRLHRLGPRRARMRETSIRFGQSSVVGRSHGGGWRGASPAPARRFRCRRGSARARCPAPRPRPRPPAALRPAAPRRWRASGARPSSSAASRRPVGQHDVGRRARTRRGRRWRGARRCAGSAGVERVEDHLAVAQRRHARRRAASAALSTAAPSGSTTSTWVRSTLQHLVGVVRCRSSASASAPLEVGDHADLAAVVGQAFAQDRCGAVLEHGGLDGAVDQQALAGVPVGAVARLDAAAVEEQAVAAGQADMLAAELQQPGHQPRDLRWCRACRRCRRSGCGRCRPSGNRWSTMARPTGRGCAFGRLEVHQQAGAGIDLDDGAALLVERARDVLGDQVDAGDVQPDDAGGQRDGVRDLGVHLVGDVDGDVAVALDQHAAGRAAGTESGVKPWRCSSSRTAGVVVEHDRGSSGKSSVGAAARVGVDLAVDQLGDARAAVAGDPGGLAARRRHHACRRPPAGGARCRARSARRSRRCLRRRRTCVGGLDLLAASSGRATRRGRGCRRSA